MQFPLSSLYKLKVPLPSYLTDRFELNPEAKTFLESLTYDKLGVVAVCGKYRTGKSYLLNKLFVDNSGVKQMLPKGNGGF